MLSAQAYMEVEQALVKLYAIRDVHIETYAAGGGQFYKLEQVQKEIRLLEEIVGAYDDEPDPAITITAPITINVAAPMPDTVDILQDKLRAIRVNIEHDQATALALKAAIQALRPTHA